MRSIVKFMFLISLAACSTPPTQPEQELEKSKQAAEPPKKPEETHWKCTILNGAGRTFEGHAATSFEAEGKAKRECQMSYRNCMLLKCDQVTE